MCKMALTIPYDCIYLSLHIIWICTWMITYELPPSTWHIANLEGHGIRPPTISTNNPISFFLTPLGHVCNPHKTSTLHVQGSLSLPITARIPESFFSSQLLITCAKQPLWNLHDQKKKDSGLRRRPEWIKRLYVKHPRPCLTEVAFDVKLLRPLHEVDTIFSEQ